MSGTPPPVVLDWGIGRYEHTAAQLAPAAEVVVDAAEIAPGERVLDLGCGTGNAALLAAARGGVVTGVDPAARLLEVARERAADQGLAATFVAGEAASVPLPDASIDVLLSVFGVVFAPDPRAAAAEMARVAAPGGRIVLSAWIPEGAISEMARTSREAVREALGIPAPPRPFQWHERDALAELLAPHGFDVGAEEHRIAFAAPSPLAFLEADSANHPMAVGTRAVLEPRGKGEALRDRLLAILETRNEDRAACRVTSRYIVATARRAQSER